MTFAITIILLLCWQYFQQNKQVRAILQLYQNQKGIETESVNRALFSGNGNAKGLLVCKQYICDAQGIYVMVPYSSLAVLID